MAEQSMSDDRIAEIKARANAATPGPWTASAPHPYCGEIWVVGPDDPDGAIATGFDDTPADAAFIAHARTDVPWLLDRIEALEQELAAQRAIGEAAEHAIEELSEAALGWEPNFPEDVERAAREALAAYHRAVADGEGR